MEQRRRIVVEDGLLKLRCKREQSGNYHFTSGEITTAGKVTFYKGRIEIRAKLNYARGTWPSFWTMNSGWSRYNEIDVFEQLSGSDWIGGTLHVGSNGSIMSSNHAAPEDGVRFRDGFHRIGAIVTDRELIWYVDDHIFKRMDITARPIAPERSRRLSCSTSRRSRSTVLRHRPHLTPNYRIQFRNGIRHENN